MNSREVENGTPAGPPDPSKRGRKLGSIANVRAALAWLWRRVEAKEIDLPSAKVLSSISYALVAAMKASELEQRLAELEKAVAAPKHDPLLRKQAATPTTREVN